MHPVTLDSDIGSTQIASPYEANIYRAGLNNPTFPYSSHTVAPVLLTEHSTEYLRSTYDSSSTFAPRFNATNNLWHFYSEAVPGPVEVQPATYSQELHALYTNSLFVSPTEAQRSELRFLDLPSKSPYSPPRPHVHARSRLQTSV